MVDSNTTPFFKSLEALYLQGKYSEAKALLFQEKEKFDQGIFHYNLGTINGKENNLAAARYNLEKALNYGLINSKVIYNLQSVKKELGDNDFLKIGSLADKTVGLGLELPTSIYFSFSLLLMIIFLVLIRFKLIKKLWIILTCFLFSALPYVGAKFYLEKINFAIVLTDTKLREGPSGIYPELSDLRAGSKIAVGEFNEGWFYVQYPSAKNGWVFKDQLAVY